MKIFFLTQCLLFIFLCCINAQAQEKPNVIVIMADDLGYADVGFNGSTEIPTPNIDRIADNGVKFTNGYTTYPVCGPSRAGFITGRYQQRFGFERNPLYRVNDPYMGLPLDEMTIAESVSQVGYTSGIIGKWHLGAHVSNHPLNRGFDEFFGHLGGGHKYFPGDLTIQNSYDAKNESESYTTWLMRNHSHEKTDEYITDEFSNEAVDFVFRHKDNPFFLFLSYNAPHTPMEAKAEDLAKFPNLIDEAGHKRKTYAAMVHAVDRGVGKLLDKLQELNIEENTIIFFLSDNGGPINKNASDNGILRGGKSDVYEGGYRVPFAMQWKGAVASGTVYEKPVSSLDIFATLSALSGAPTKPEKPLDGVNLIPYLNEEKEDVPHETIYIRKFDQDRHAVRHGDYKIIYFKDNTNKKLYNLSNNVRESDGSNLYWNESYLAQRELLDSLREDWESELIHPRFLGLVHDELVWATEVSLSETNMIMNSSDTKQLNGTILPLDAFNDVIEWTSNNTSVATVDETGLVTAHEDGYATIIAKVVDRQQVFKECVVQVGNPLAATGINLTITDTTVLVGGYAQIVASVTPEDNSYAIDWSSNNPEVATVDQNGFVLTHGRGSAEITAKVIGSEHKSAVCNINVDYNTTTTSINDNKVSITDNITIHPNPTSSGEVVLNFNSFVDRVFIEVFNSIGQREKIVVANKTERHVLDVNNLTEGIYFLKLNFGDEKVTKKLIVKK